MLNYKEMNFTGYSFSHAPLAMDQNLLQRNQQIFDHYNNDSSDMVQHINMTVPKSGLLNKYQF